MTKISIMWQIKKSLHQELFHESVTQIVVVDTIGTNQQLFYIGVKIKATGNLKLNSSPEIHASKILFFDRVWITCIIIWLGKLLRCDWVRAGQFIINS